ncbi:DUF4652 domain-containing protein [Mycoplasmatota bacterium zrk1]
MKKTIKMIVIIFSVYLLGIMWQFTPIVFQEGNPIPILSSIIKLESGKDDYIEITDNRFITKTSSNDNFFDFIEQEHNVIETTQMGAGYFFSGNNKGIMLETRKFTSSYTLWNLNVFNGSDINLDQYDLLVRFRDDRSVYYGGPKYDKKIILKSEDGIEFLCEGYIPRPILNSNNEMIAYIDNISFEKIGNAFIFDNNTKKIINITNLSYSSNNTVKDIEWLDEDNLLLVIGYAYGTVTKGGNLYRFNLIDKELRLIDNNLEDSSEIIDILIDGDKVVLRGIKWSDENYLQYDYFSIILKYDDIFTF